MARKNRSTYASTAPRDTKKSQKSWTDKNSRNVSTNKHHHAESLPTDGARRLAKSHTRNDKESSRRKHGTTTRVQDAYTDPAEPLRTKNIHPGLLTQEAKEGAEAQTLFAPKSLVDYTQHDEEPLSMGTSTINP